jgi:SWI/SNF-related matrix-associated actin-dependent regulator 1 of chromatin subfamily A
LFPNEWVYYQRYCKAHHNGYGWDFSGADHTEELHKLLVDSIMLRRLKKDVLKDLPDKVRSFIPIELTNTKEYFEAESNFVAYIRRIKGREAAIKASAAEALASIEGLKQLAVTGKLNGVINWIKNFLEVDGKLVVFATHKFVIDKLMEEFKDIAVKVDGSVTGSERQSAVDQFQTQEHIRLFVGNIKAAGVGLTLTAASNVAFIELPWTPGDLVQAEDRCHRIGQKYSVNIHYLLALRTIEERIVKILDSKRKVLDAVLDGIKTDDESLLTALINEYLKGYGEES